MSARREHLEEISRLLEEQKPGQVLDYVINMIPQYQTDAYAVGHDDGHIEGHGCGEDVAYGHGYNDGWHQGYMMGAERAAWQASSD